MDVHHPSNDELHQAATTPAFVDVPTPQLGEGWHVRVTVLSGPEMLEWDAARKDLAREDVPGEFIVRTAVHPDGTRRFTAADAKWINDSRWDWCFAVFNEAMLLNGLTQRAVDTEAKN